MRLARAQRELLRSPCTTLAGAVTAYCPTSSPGNHQTYVQVAIDLGSASLCYRGSTCTGSNWCKSARGALCRQLGRLGLLRSLGDALRHRRRQALQRRQVRVVIHADVVPPRARGVGHRGSPADRVGRAHRRQLRSAPEEQPRRHEGAADEHQRRYGEQAAGSSAARCPCPPAAPSQRDADVQPKQRMPGCRGA